MTMEEPQPQEPGLFECDVVAYSPSWRIAASMLRITSRGSLLLILAALLLSDNPPVNPLKQMRLFLGLFAAPEAAAWCIARAFAARLRVEKDVLQIQDREQVVEIPLASVAAVSPWMVPLPRSGIWLTLRSGRRLPRALQMSDPVSLVDAMVAAGAAPDIRHGLEHPMVVFARARLAYPYGRLEHPFFKFVIFSLVPTVPVFRLHQYITYGGTFGEYYTFGLGAYLLAFGIWWMSWSFNLLYIAALARAVVEVLSLAAAVVVPSFATGVRRGLEVTQRVIYYLGIPTWIALRLLA